MAHYTINRKTWYRGRSGGGSSLLRSDGMRCCIGQIGEQIGIPDKFLLNVPVILAKQGNDAVYSIPDEERTKFPEWMRSENDLDGKGIWACYRTNDQAHGDNGAGYMSEELRESRLIEAFASHGDTLEFVD